MELDNLGFRGVRAGTGDKRVVVTPQLIPAAGTEGGGASYEYDNGPDGKRYAVGGEVSIDTSTVSGDPQATIQNQNIPCVGRLSADPGRINGPGRAPPEGEPAVPHSSSVPPG